MSVSTKLNQLSQIRTSIRNAIIAKGVNASGHGFGSFATDIAAISTTGDFSGTTATADTVFSGVKFYDSSGTLQTGAVPYTNETTNVTLVSRDGLSLDVNKYLSTLDIKLNTADWTALIPDNIRQGQTILGVAGTCGGYSAPTGTIEQTLTDNGTYTINCAGKAQVTINVNVAGSSTGGDNTDEEDDDDIMTIIPCKITVDAEGAAASIQFNSSAYSDLATVRDSTKPYAVKIKAAIYVDMTEAEMGVLYAEDLYLNLSSYNSSELDASNIDYAIFDGSTGGDSDTYCPMQVTINCDSNAASVIWYHITDGAMTADTLDATFDLED